MRAPCSSPPCLARPFQILGRRDEANGEPRVSKLMVDALGRDAEALERVAREVKAKFEALEIMVGEEAECLIAEVLRSNINWQVERT